MLASVPRIAIAVGSSMATVAVFDTNADSAQVMKPNATIVRIELLPTPGTASTRNAKRRATPVRSIDWAMMNAPMKTKTVVEPSGAITSSTGATPIIAMSTMPMRPPIGIGTASLIQSTIDEQQRRGELLLRRLHVERQQEEDQEHGRRQEQADRAPCLLELLLLRAQLLLAERAIGPYLGEALERVAAC